MFDLLTKIAFFSFEGWPAKYFPLIHLNIFFHLKKDKFICFKGYIPISLYTLLGGFGNQISVVEIAIFIFALVAMA